MENGQLPYMTGTSSWDPVKPPGNKQPPLDHHDNPRPPATTLVGGGGTRYQRTTRRYYQGSLGMITIHQGIWDHPVDGGMLQMGSQRLPGADLLHSRPRT